MSKYYMKAYEAVYGCCKAFVYTNQNYTSRKNELIIWNYFLGYLTECLIEENNSETFNAPESLEYVE